METTFLEATRQFLEAIAGAGVPGIVLGVVIFVTVWAAKRVGLVVTGNMARIANLALAVILSGLAADANIEAGLVAAVGALASAAMHEFLEWLNARFASKKK